MALPLYEKLSAQHVSLKSRSSSRHIHSHSLKQHLRPPEEPPSEPNHFRFSSRTRALIIMVAIPAYLLASASLSYLHNSLTERSPAPSPGSAAAGVGVEKFASILGPVVTDNFPDPAIIVVDDISYAFATNNRGLGPSAPTMIHVQVAMSTDNTTWQYLTGLDALPTVGAWETGNRVWAPDVVQLDDGTFVMYYTDEPTSSPAHHCIGAASSKTVTGPYTPLSTPFACPDLTTKGGAIDPDGFQDIDGRRYVTYKVDGNSIGHGGLCQNSVAPIVPTPIMLQEVGKDGITLIGNPTQILDRDEFDGPLIEAPSLYRSEEGYYFLFFSSNCFVTPLYDTSYATATNISGPYTKADRPLLITGDGPGLSGPGGTDILKGSTMFVFHSHAQGTSSKGRRGRRDPAKPFVRTMSIGQIATNGPIATVV